MSNPSPALRDALALLGQDPLPDDVEARLEALERQAPPEEADQFGDLWEALMATDVSLAQ